MSNESLIERLRAQRPEDKQAWWRASEGRYVIPLMLEAADEVEAARKQIAELEDSLAAEGCMRERAVADVIYVTRRAERAEQRVAELQKLLDDAEAVIVRQREDRKKQAERAERAEAELAAVRKDAERLDWMQARLRGASDSERYLPFRIYWGKGGDIRKVIDAARAKEQ